MCSESYFLKTGNSVKDQNFKPSNPIITLTRAIDKMTL